MADRTLIQGAADVARAQGTGKLAATAAAIDTAKFISDGVNEVIQARNKLFNNAMRKELEKTGDMTDKEYKKYARKLRRKRFEYVYLNKRGRASMINDLNKEADDITEEKKLNDEIANTPIENPSKDLGGCNAEAIAKIVSGDMEVVYDENGKAGYNMPDGRVCYAAEQEELKDYVKFDESGDPRLLSYVQAWDDVATADNKNGRFKIEGNDKVFYDPKTGKELHRYPNNKEGYQQFVDASEAYWKDKHESTGKKRKLDIDSQTGKKSTHAIWEAGNESEFSGNNNNLIPSVNKRSDGVVETDFGGSLYNNRPSSFGPMKMVSPMKANGEGEEIPDKETEYEQQRPKAGKNFKSFGDIRNMVKQASVDENSFSAIRSVVANAALTAEQIQPGENNEFNYKKNYNNIRQQIVAKGNLRSLAQNTNPFGRVFVEDLAEAIMSSSYEDLGIKSVAQDKGKLQSMDPTPKTPINPADAEVIVRNIYNNPKRLMDYVSEYYTNMAEQNFNDNLKPETAQNYDYKLTYAEAFNSARKRFGSGRSFTYKGKSYSTNTESDLMQNENEFA